MLPLLTALTITDKPTDLPGGTVSAFYPHGGERLVADVKAGAATTVTLYRYNDSTQEWTPSAAGAETITSTATQETRWDVGGVRARYVMVSTGGVTGFWCPMQGSVQ